jgi:hypothetical protein
MSIMRLTATRVAALGKGGVIAMHGKSLKVSLRQGQVLRSQDDGSSVITMIHRQERSLLGFSVARHIDLEDAQGIVF